jgi:hypothetical protein
MLKFSDATKQAKLKTLVKVKGLKRYLAKGRKLYTLSLLAGWSCPHAKECLSKVIIKDGKRRIQDGKDIKNRCFDATQEAQYEDTYNQRKHNFETLRRLSEDEMYTAINEALPKNTGIVRIHVSGDFFNQKYFNAWLRVAQSHPDILFYAYTKSLPYWIAARTTVDKLDNLVLTASIGGTHDHLIKSHKLRSALVINTVDGVRKRQGDRINVSMSPLKAHWLPIDHDDSHAADPTLRTQDFALLIHGTQPKGSAAAKAKKELAGLGSYSR